MNFSDLLAALRASPSHEVTVPASWAQGRALFGGLVAGLLHEAMRGQVAPERLLRSFSVSFVGPLAADAPLQVSAQLLREGRAVSQVEARAMQDGAVLAVALGSFGAARESQLQAPAEPPPAVRPPAESQAWQYVPGMSPAFTQHFDWRWAIGPGLFAGTAAREMGGWIRYRDPQPAVTESHLLGLVDAWPPAVLPMITQPAPASTLTWSIDFVHPLPALRADDWVLYRAVVDHARDGYGQTSARAWGPGGRLLALSRQTVTVFA